jgi:hypothetical protein
MNAAIATGGDMIIDALTIGLLLLIIIIIIKQGRREKYRRCPMCQQLFELLSEYDVLCWKCFRQEHERWRQEQDNRPLGEVIKETYGFMDDLKARKEGKR